MLRGTTASPYRANGNKNGRQIFFFVAPALNPVSQLVLRQAKELDTLLVYG